MHRPAAPTAVRKSHAYDFLFFLINNFLFLINFFLINFLFLINNFEEH